MAIRHVSIAAIATLLSAAVTGAQPQTTSDESTPTGTTATQTTPSASTPATNPGSTTTGTATDTSTGSQGMQGGFRGTPADPAPSDTATAPGTTGSTTTSSSAAANADTATSTTAPGTATATANTAGSTPLQGQDATFLRKAMEGDRMEIASAQTALDQAERADTKNTARMIVEDHQKSSQQLQSLASRKGWTLPSAASADSDQAMTSTAGSGSFDDQFMADQIRMHREAISLYRAQIASGSDPDLRQFARDQLPHLEHHLEMLQGANTQK